MLIDGRVRSDRRHSARQAGWGAIPEMVPVQDIRAIPSADVASSRQGRQFVSHGYARPETVRAAERAFLDKQRC